MSKHTQDYMFKMVPGLKHSPARIVGLGEYSCVQTVCSRSFDFGVWPLLSVKQLGTDERNYVDEL
jgi:hypothetical protein